MWQPLQQICFSPVFQAFALLLLVLAAVLLFGSSEGAPLKHTLLTLLPQVSQQDIAGHGPPAL